MRDFLRYLFVVTAMLMVVVGDVWAECYVYGPTGEYSTTIGSGMGEFTLPDGASGGTLIYEFKLGKTANKTHYATAQYKTSDSWTESWKELKKAGTKSNSYEGNTVSVAIPSDAYKIRFYASADFGGAQKVYVNNVRITRVVYANAPKNNTLNLGTKVVGAVASEASTIMSWSNTNPFTYTLTGSNLFSVEIENNAVADGCSSGDATIKVTYKHTEVGPINGDQIAPHTAILTIKTAQGEYKINLSGTTLPKQTVFSWNLATEYLVGDEGELIGLYNLKDLNNIDLKNDLHSAIEFTSTNTNVVAIEDGKIKAKNEGVATINAIFLGKDGWELINFLDDKGIFKRKLDCIITD